jgi:phage tail-like protein
MRRNDWLVGQLPMGMLDDDFFVRFVSLFEEVATSLLHGADNIGNIVDLTVAPPEVVRWLGSWIGLRSIDASLPEELQRRLVHESSRVLAWRGTRYGLQRFLEAITGGPVDITDSGTITREGEAGERPPAVKVVVRGTGWLAEPEFVALVADEVPANAMLEVWVGDRKLWPPAPSPEGGATLVSTGTQPEGDR